MNPGPRGGRDSMKNQFLDPVPRVRESPFHYGCPFAGDLSVAEVNMLLSDDYKGGMLVAYPNVLQTPTQELDCKKRGSDPGRSPRVGACVGP
jgi:hypothetical protein